MTDIYGRTVTVSTADGHDIYTVTDSSGNVVMTVTRLAGEPSTSAMSTINAMPPQGWVDPNASA